MSFARIGVESDVYIYHHYQGFIECCGCSLTPAEDGKWVGYARLQTARRALRHLDAHISAGHKVPDRAYDKIYETYKFCLDDPIQPFLDTPEQRERQQKRIKRLFEFYAIGRK
jgi:hypothetical protein